MTTFKNKRIINEIKKYWEISNLTNTYIEEVPAIFIDYNTENQEVIFLISFYNEKYTCIITMKFYKKTYPFKPPEIVVNDKYNYKRMLTFSSDWNERFNIKKCLCCSSILCEWGPRYNMLDIVREIHKNLKYKLRIREILMCKSFVRQKFGHYLPIDEFL